MANPKVGQSATLNGKKVVWSGQNYGWQSPATHNKLAKDGKFRGGTQALDRLTSSAKNLVKDKLPGVAKAATNYKNWSDESARRVAARDAKTTVGKGINAVKTVTNAPARAKDAAVQAVANKTNLDPRIVRAGVEVVGALAKTKAGQGIVKASGGRIAPPTNRSVGAAARSDVAGRTAPATRRLNTPKTDGVVRPSSSKPKPSITPAERQRLSRGLQQAAGRQGSSKAQVTSVTPTKPLPKPSGKGGQRRITPATRAQAVQRQNQRQARSKGYTSDDGTTHYNIETNGMRSTSHASGRYMEDGLRTRHSKTNADARSKRRLNKDHDVSFKETKAEDYRRGRETGLSKPKTSKVRTQLKSANVSDQLGHHMSRVKPGDHVRATPINDVNRRTGDLSPRSARARYYSQKSNNALSSTKVNSPDYDVPLHDVNARRGRNNNWTNPANSTPAGKGRVVQRDVKWNPAELHKALDKLANSKGTLVGRRAGGDSNVKVNVKREAAPRSVGAAGRPDTRGGGGRNLYRPGKDGVVTKSGDKVRGRVSNYKAQIGSRTKTNTPTARRVAAQTSTAARRSQGRTTANAPVRSGRPSTRTIPTSSRVTASRGTPTNGTATRVSTPKGSRQRSRIQRNIPAIQGRQASRTKDALTAKRRRTTVGDSRSAQANRTQQINEPGTNPTRTRRAAGTRNDATVRPPRSSNTRMTRAQQSQTLRSTLRGRGDSYVQATVGNRDVANQVRRNSNRGGGTMTTYGETNARRRAAAQTTTPTRSGGRNSVQNNARTAGRQAVDTFEARARTIINDRIRREGANMTSRERQALTRRLQREMRQGATRVRAAAESQSTRTANETRSNTRNFQGSGRTAYQEPNRNDRRGGRSEAQMRRRASSLRIRQGTPQSRTTTANPRTSSPNPRVSPAVSMRRRRAAG